MKYLWKYFKKRAHKFLLFTSYLVIKVIGRSYRYRYLNKEQFFQNKELGKNKNYLFALWHQNIVGSLLGHQDYKHVMLVSPSQDGDFVSYAAEKFGNITIRGSSNKNSLKALAQFSRYLKQGEAGAITVDGPRGPAKSPKFGIFELAKKTETVIIPVTAVVDKYWRLNSWDKFIIPRPFGKIVICYGRPIIVRPDCSKDDYEQLAEKLKQELEYPEQRNSTIFEKWKHLDQSISNAS